MVTLTAPKPKHFLDRLPKIFLENACGIQKGASQPSIDTHKFTANGLDVNARIAPMTLPIASGDNEWAPNDPRPPKSDTAAVNAATTALRVAPERWGSRSPAFR